MQRRHTGRLVEVRGTRLFVEEVGDPAAPTLVFVHGGPGQGCADFWHHQARLLGRDLHVVALDQRGALRSQSLAADERLDEQVVVADLEALREALGVASWSLLGHSMGARVVLRYALAHPASTTCVLFENPAWDLTATQRCLVTAALPLLAEHDDEDGLAEARELLARQRPLDAEAYLRRRVLMARLGDRLDRLYVHRGRLDSLLVSTSLPPDALERSHEHARRLLLDTDLAEPLLPMLRRLDAPAHLLLGLYDHVTDDDTIELFNAWVEEGETTWFEESAHYCHAEEPEAYARTVVGTLLAHADA